jgi:hypothetical protein
MAQGADLFAPVCWFSAVAVGIFKTGILRTIDNFGITPHVVRRNVRTIIPIDCRSIGKGAGIVIYPLSTRTRIVPIII